MTAELVTSYEHAPNCAWLREQECDCNPHAPHATWCAVTSDGGCDCGFADEDEGDEVGPHTCTRRGIFDGEWYDECDTCGRRFDVDSEDA